MVFSRFIVAKAVRGSRRPSRAPTIVAPGIANMEASRRYELGLASFGSLAALYDQLEYRARELLVVGADEFLELLDPLLVAMARLSAGAIDDMVEPEDVTALEAAHDEPYLALGETRDVGAALLLALDVAVQLCQHIGEITHHLGHKVTGKGIQITTRREDPVWVMPPRLSRAALAASILGGTLSDGSGNEL